MDNLLRTLRSKGFKLTPQRRAVITALRDCGPFPTAQGILRQVKKTAPDTGLDTVYRNLGLLVDLGLVNEIKLPGQAGTAFEITNGQHHHHLICLGCGQTTCLDYCPVSPADIARAEQGGFTVVSHSLELYGYCRTCRATG